MNFICKLLGHKWMDAIKNLLGIRKPSQVYRDVMIGYDFDTVKKFSELARFTGKKTLDDSK